MWEASIALDSADTNKRLVVVFEDLLMAPALQERPAHMHLGAVMTGQTDRCIQGVHCSAPDWLGIRMALIHPFACRVLEGCVLHLQDKMQ